MNTDELVAKRANAERIKMFSRNLRVINREEEVQAAARREASGGGAAQPSPPSAAPLSKAQKAREYAKAVPKPRIRPKEEPKAGGGDGGAELVDVEEELDALALLEKQHNEHKAQAALIRAELGL